jgi:hypothetical protein
MRTVKVKKNELLETVKKNRNQHKEIFEEALEGYRQKLLKYLEERIEDVRSGKKIEQYIALVEPVNQTKDYDKVIKMLEMSVDDIIDLDSVSFSNFVMDEWNWSDTFLNTNACYSTKAGSALQMKSVGQ